jgi:chromate reductase, NAD(P)H dehydrogenase (quinone)
MSAPLATTLKVALLSGSLRKDSLNTKLLHVVAARVRAAGCEAVWIDLPSFALPVIDEDLIVEDKVPAEVARLGGLLHSVQAVVAASPEYNGTISAVTKNVVDWTSCLRPHPWTGKHVFLAAATPGPMSALRGLWHSRVPFEVLGAHVYPEMFGLGLAEQHLKEPGAIADAKTAERLGALIDRFLAFAAKATRE